MGKNKVLKRGQVSIFFIVAIVIVVGVALFLVIKNAGIGGGIPTELQPVYDYYEQCIQRETISALDLAGSQGGRVVPGDYIPGSDYAPFASHLNFLGFPVPYWYYVSGNGVIKEQVPSKSEIEQEMGEYLSGRIASCDFEPFFSQGFLVEAETPEVKVEIEEQRVKVRVDGDVSVSKDETRANSASRTSEVASNFGLLYNRAIDLYNKEAEEAFIENYTVDVLRLYAPVDGIEIQCSPLIWNAEEVVNDLHGALESNIASLRFGETAGNYFSVPFSNDVDVRALYSSSWPWKVEIHGSDDGIMIAEPVGNQQGLGILGFCYVPYHFVYDISYPVLFQVSKGEEIFQFPVAIIIDKNLPRQADLSGRLIEEEIEVDICDVKTQDVEIKVFDSSLNPVDAKISYSCFDQRCQLGSSEQGVFVGNAPACVNGILEARAEGYSPKRQIFSTNSETKKEIILDKLYEVEVELNVGGRALEGNAIVTFSGAEESASAVMPEVKKVKLSEGAYNLSVYVYGNSSLKLPESRRQECTNVPASGIGGIFGVTDERCYEIVTPATNIDFALLGGGQTSTYFVPSQLEGGKIILSVDKLPSPSSLEELQNNYAVLASSGVVIS